MRSRSIVILLALVALGSLLEGFGSRVRAQDTRPGIAVFMFDDGGSFGQNKENLDGLQRNGSRQIRPLAHFEQAMFGANLAILPQVPASLPHEPYGPYIGRTPTASVQKTSTH